MSEKFVRITGAAAPILQANIDTDTIAPAIRKSQVGQKLEFNERDADDLAKNLFAGWRYDDKDNELPDFILNKPGFRETKIILAGDNFACGSSRESANWMLADFGIRVIVAPSYGEIFYNNCFKNGILPVTLESGQISELAKESGDGAPGAQFTVDLEFMTITPPGNKSVAFSLPEFRRQGLLSGRDEISVTLQRRDEITAFHSAAKSKRPWVYL
jgi:3-isopropylmalate/(R)-2-methylmalate dehydratase small subunit